MSELKIDNPALRLLDILEKGQGYNRTDNCRKVWMEILQAENERTLLVRLAQVMELPARISQVMNDNFPESRWSSSHLEECIEKAFISQRLSDGWNTFKDYIDDQALSELGLLSMTFETRGVHSGIAPDKLDALLKRISELRGDIRNSALPAAMKTLLLKQLAQLHDALESYSISGVEPVMDAVQSTLGLAVLHPEYRNEISKGTGSHFGEKISTLLTDTASVVTIAGAMPMISGAVKTALACLSK